MIIELEDICYVHLVDCSERPLTYRLLKLFLIICILVHTALAYFYRDAMLMSYNYTYSQNIRRRDEVDSIQKKILKKSENISINFPMCEKCFESLIKVNSLEIKWIDGNKWAFCNENLVKLQEINIIDDWFSQIKNNEASFSIN